MEFYKGCGSRLRQMLENYITCGFSKLLKLSYIFKFNFFNLCKRFKVVHNTYSVKQRWTRILKISLRNCVIPWELCKIDATLMEGWRNFHEFLNYLSHSLRGPQNLKQILNWQNREERNVHLNKQREKVGRLKEE